MAAFIDNNFEPTWQSVAAVPTVTIDFGGDRKIKRTFRGNIATYVLSQDGTIIDILPGLIQPATYKQLLERSLSVYQDIEKNPRKRQQIIAAHHQKSLTTDSGSESTLRADANSYTLADSSPIKTDALLSDTILNELHRHPAIHQRLLKQPDARVTSELTDWVYEDILEVKLSDPYLGYGAMVMDLPENNAGSDH